MPEPEPQYEARSIMDNLRLIATRRTVTIFVINPLVFWSVWWYTILPPHSKEWDWIPVKFRIISMIAVMLLVFALMGSESDRIKKRLEREGYVQRRERRREIDYWMNLAVCGAFFIWTQQDARKETIETAEEFGPWILYAYIVLCSVMITVSAEYLLLGSVVWFTARQIPSDPQT